MGLLWARLRGLVPHRLRRLAHSFAVGPRVLLALFFLATLEVLGRLSPSDWVDGVGVLLVLSVAMRWATGARVQALRERALGWLEPVRVRYGIDLRGAPPLPARTPWRTLAAWGATLALAGALFAARAALPGPLRAALRQVSGAAWILLLTGLWSALAFVTLSSWFAVTSLLREERGRPAEPRRVRVLAFGLFLATAAAAAGLSPRWGLALVVGAGAGFALALPCAAGSLRVAWRRARDGAGSSPSWGRWGSWEATATTWVLALALLPCLAAVGELFDGPGRGADESAATGWLGRMALWSLAVSATLFFGTHAARLVRARLSDPARPAPTRVLVTGALDGDRRRRAARALRAAGFAPGFRSRPGAIEVALELVDGAVLESWERWPLAVRIEDLDEPELHARILRRDRRQRRRVLLRRLDRILKHALRERYERGTGFWIAPHLWLVTHLSRDQDEDDQRAIGPRYARALPRAARAYLSEVLRDLEIDLLFLEDGVGRKRFRRVLELVFEHHDLFGARRCADERHFSGIPGTRVLIHEIGLDPPLSEGRYPEPEHEELGRARILHVFRDRGEPEVPVSAPRDRDRLPAWPRLTPV